MQNVIDKMLAGLITTDMDGRIETVNPAAEAMFGYTSDELIGQSLKRLMAAPAVDAEAMMQRMPGAALDKVTEWPARRKDGSTFPMELSLFTFETSRGLHMAGTVRDISERREIDRMKDEFVSVVSHELRTPLTSIRGALQLVLADPPAFTDDDQAPLLDLALQNCERLIRLVNDILDVSNIEAGQIRLNRQPCDVTAIVHAGIDSVTTMARAASVRFVVESAGRLSVDADADRLVQVLTNLLSNAVKFSGARSTVHVRSRSNGDRVEIDVQDRGPGIPEDQIGRLFQKFHQLDSSATRHRGGTGLGLAIARAIVEQHDGTLSVDSRLGAGSTFTVSLPRSDAALPDAPVPIGRSAAASVRPCVVLAEDDDDLRDVMAQTLSRRGFRVMPAPNGDVARSLYDTTPCDALIVDLHMPVTDGFDLIAHVRGDDRGRSIPILVVSGSNTGHGQDRSMSLGANVFFSKPVDPDRLVSELHRLMIAIPET